MAIVPRAAEQVSLRLPPGMRDAIAVRAAKAGRSANTEIVTILADALGDKKSAPEGASTPARA